MFYSFMSVFCVVDRYKTKTSIYLNSKPITTIPFTGNRDNRFMRIWETDLFYNRKGAHQ